jgi:hypothetical protein
MDIQTLRQSALLARLKDELLRDKRKTVALAVTFVVFCGFAGRSLLWSPSPSAGAEATGASVGGLSPAQHTPAFAEGGSHAATDVRGDVSAPRRQRSISRDLFAVDIDQFPPKERSAPVSVLPADVPASPPDGQESADRVVQAQARALILQSTVVSEDPIAIVNGRVLRVGDLINGFQVVLISSRGCTLEKRGVKVLLEMDG